MAIVLSTSTKLGLGVCVLLLLATTVLCLGAASGWFRSLTGGGFSGGGSTASRERTAHQTPIRLHTSRWRPYTDFGRCRGAPE
ncbi:hypothetical protein FJT64_026270 [Amphibalanus amphitrite]|uniref:Uncharacterized protein n=1 Tax=Amphibalanus amphitrite TaxID=1232801 RepID=A0A6A4WCQ5_AMPAM|nr:hypothetical protein FJT64_026270 [Amphibalanus amphitrite]